MEYMEDRTLKIIYALKHDNRPWHRVVSEVMCDETGHPADQYYEDDLNAIMETAFLDFIRTCDRPQNEVRRLFEAIENNNRTESIGNVIARVFRMTQVRDEYGYINGFRELEE